MENENKADPADFQSAAVPPMLGAASLGQSSRKIRQSSRKVVEEGATKLSMAALPGNMTEEVMAKNFGSFWFMLLCSIVVASLTAPLLVLIFGCLRVEKEVNWPWLKLAIPLFILQGLCLLFLLMGILHPPKQPQGMSQKDPAYIIWKHQSGTFRWFCSFLQLICLIAVEVQIFGMMDGDIEEDLGYILPWFVYVFFEFFAVLARSRPALGSLEDDFPDIEQDRRAEAEAIISKLTSDFKNFVFGAIMRTLAVLFVMLKVDGEIGWNWFAVMWPVWVYAAGVLVSMQVRKQQAKSAPQVQVIQLPLRQQDGLQPQAQQVRVQLQSTNAKSEGAKVDALESVVFLYVMMAAMLCNKLEGRWDGSAWVLVSPLLIVLGCGYCACCCFICFSCLPDDKTDNGSSSV